MRITRTHSLAGVIGAALLTAASSAFAEATIDEVYKAAAAGQVTEAQAMMQDVLKAHPDSAKAHFVEAELLARQRDISGARAELARATAINPSLSFAKPQAVESLKRQLGGNGERVIQRAPAVSRGMPSWFWPIGLGLLIAFIVWMVRTRLPGPGYSGGAGNMNPYPTTPYSPYGAPPQAPSGGSGLLGSLATGAAIGGGIVAGEALAHRLLDSDEPRHFRDGDYGPSNYDNAPQDNSMGGDDFGISDSGGWDDDNSGGGGW
ncbi:tetratricopeptide repeat protein [Hydrocarboniphaga sp.]|uniref:tetratricopeptide repeat protein n=1 Tax=Hydrocarboniphaga sp. TaxID=2033016 RepID=UPI002614485E|nr:tetratricopeptide repeat protein [Hydrocarboniphaga sp.]